MENSLSTWGKKLQKYYKKGFWTKEMLKNVVGKKITEEEYQIITGEPFSEDE